MRTVAIVYGAVSFGFACWTYGEAREDGESRPASLAEGVLVFVLWPHPVIGALRDSWKSFRSGR